MTTTAHEDQFTDGTQTIQPVLQPYSTEAILRRNIADAKKEMQRQAERAESYADALRSLASYVGAGGYNADTVDAGVFEEKIRWGIGEIMTRAEAQLKEMRDQVPLTWGTSGELIDILKNPIYSAPVIPSKLYCPDCNKCGAVERAERAEAALKEAREQEPVLCHAAFSNGDGTYSYEYAKWPLRQHEKPTHPVDRFFYARPVPAAVAVPELSDGNPEPAP